MYQMASTMRFWRGNSGPKTTSEDMSTDTAQARPPGYSYADIVTDLREEVVRCCNICNVARAALGDTDDK